MHLIEDCTITGDRLTVRTNPAFRRTYLWGNYPGLIGPSVCM